MKPNRLTFLFVFLSFASSLIGQTSPASGAPDQLQSGIVVERVVKGSEGEKAGLTEGDVLLHWTRGTASGDFTFPFDLAHLELEQRSRGKVIITGLRDKQPHVWEMGSDLWSTRTRPNLSGDLWIAYSEGRDLAKAGKWTEAASRWKTAPNNGGVQPDWVRAWFSFSAATAMGEAKQWKEVDELYREAVQTAAEPQMQVPLLRAWGASFQARNNWVEAARCYREALQIAHTSQTGAMTEALLLLQLGTIARNQEHLAEAESYMRQSLAIEEKEVPGSLDQGATFNGLGNVASDRGNLAEAEAWLQRYLEICRKRAPGGANYSAALSSLGAIARRRGDLAKAESYYREAVEIQQKIGALKRWLSYSLLGLGTVARTRGDWSKAESYYNRALALQQEVSSYNIDAAATLGALGGNAVDRGDLQEAETYLQRAIEMQQRLQPDTLTNADSITNLAIVKRKRGDLEGARSLFASAESIYQKNAPEGMDHGEALSAMGDLSQDSGRLEEAETYYRRALAIFEKLTPGSIFQAETWAELAGNMRRRQQWEKAAPLYDQALAALETQTGRVGGDAEGRSDFRARHARYYAEYIDVLVALKNPEKAFQVLERSRARALLETLASAHVDVDRHADIKLVDQERSLRADLNAKSDRRIRLLAEKDSGEQATQVDKEIAELLNHLEDVESKIRISTPAYAALIQPQSLSASDVQRTMLDRETLLLEYSLGEERSYVFAVGQDSLEAFALPRRAEIEKAARHVYELLTTHNRNAGAGEKPETSQSAEKDRTEYSAATAELSRMLLEPVAAKLNHKRLLIVADGALQYVPFAILPEPKKAHEGTAQMAAPLVVEHEIVNLPSASVLALIRKERMEHGNVPKAVAVLADPVFDKRDTRVMAGNRSQPVLAMDTASEKRSAQSEDEQPADDPLAEDRLVRSAADVGINRGGRLLLPRLRYSRMEAEEIQTVMPRGRTMMALDFDANRKIATSPDLAHYGIIHFATHGLVDSEHPELSGLVFSMVDKDGKPQDGFLQLQDIYNLNLPADLVVLSACETALGKEISGEGLIGLTRGFMYAGASRVVASLWKVSDVATARLMAEFYRAMEKDGMPASAALRVAQIKMLKQERWQDPYFWAAFQIQGEWR